MYGKAWDTLLVFELAQVVHESLGAADGEGGNDDGAAALGNTIDDGGELFGGIARLALAVGGFAEEDVGGDGRCGGIIENGLIVASDIAGEHDDSFLAAFVDGENEGGGAENVAGVVRINVKFGADVEGAGAGHGFQGAQDGVDVVGSVEGIGVGVAIVGMILSVASIFFLEVGGVFEEEGD